ncbi:MAG: PDZ domain-containing protein [Candidatus Riflebacteria bacterium]|nr:PDZ domain-containing protein [Candidatus Riflebacteria bacterium]
MKSKLEKFQTLLGIAFFGGIIISSFDQTLIAQQVKTNQPVADGQVNLAQKPPEPSLMNDGLLLDPSLASIQSKSPKRILEEALMEQEIRLTPSFQSGQGTLVVQPIVNGPLIVPPKSADEVLLDLRKMINQRSIRNLHKSAPVDPVISGPNLPQNSISQNRVSPKNPEDAILELRKLINQRSIRNLHKLAPADWPANGPSVKTVALPVKSALPTNSTNQGSTASSANFPEPAQVEGVSNSWINFAQKVGPAKNQEEILMAQEDVLIKKLIKKLQIFEAHWQGSDLMELDVTLKRQLGYPLDLEGIIVNEVTFNTQAAGIMGADVIQALNGIRVKTLQQFKDATRLSQLDTRAKVQVWRKGKTLTFEVVAEDGLGLAQAESAPMIMPGEPRPHPHLGPCTNCHIIRAVITAEITPDPDDIILQPRAITPATRNPHEARGPCNACHVVKLNATSP